MPWPPDSPAHQPLKILCFLLIRISSDYLPSEPGRCSITLTGWGGLLRFHTKRGTDTGRHPGDRQSLTQTMGEYFVASGSAVCSKRTQRSGAFLPRSARLWLFVLEEVREAGKPEFGFPSFALSCWGFKQQLTRSEEHRQLSVWRQMAGGRFLTCGSRSLETHGVKKWFPCRQQKATGQCCLPVCCEKNTALKLFSEEAMLYYLHNLII